MDTQFLSDADNAEGWTRWTFIIRNHVLRRISWHSTRRLVFFFSPQRGNFSSPSKMSQNGFSEFRSLTWMSFTDGFGCEEETCIVFHLIAIVDVIPVGITIACGFGHFIFLGTFFHWKLLEDFSIGKIWLLNDFLAVSGVSSDVFTIFVIFNGNLTLFQELSNAESSFERVFLKQAWGKEQFDLWNFSYL